jgi:hypothetical protein
MPRATCKASEVPSLVPPEPNLNTYNMPHFELHNTAGHACQASAVPQTRQQGAPFAAADRGTFATLTGSCSTEAPMPLLGDISLFTLRLRGTLMRGTFTGADCKWGRRGKGMRGRGGCELASEICS